jgi:predicted permease
MLNDIRYGIRSLLKRPGFTVVAITTLALGIGANTAIFSVTDKLLVRTLPVREPEQLFLITSVSVSPHFVSNAFSYPDYSDYRKKNAVLSGLVAFSKTELELRTNSGIERVPAEFVSDNFFEVLGVNAAQGRTFAAEESGGPQPQVVISEEFRLKQFGNEKSPVGEKITLNDLPLTVIGVTPNNFGGMTLEKPADIWVPVSMHKQLAQSTFIENRKDRWLQLLGRIKPGISAIQAQTSLDLLAQHVKEANTPPGTITKGLPFSEQHINLEYGGKGISILRQRFAAPLKLLMGVVALVLLIACANVAGLLLARGVARKKEIAIRLSLGANSLQVVRQLLIESLLLALSGGIAGLVLAPWLVSLLVNSQPRLTVAQNLLNTTLDLRVLAFTAFTTILAGLIFGLLPAWQSSRADLIPMLKDESGTSHGEQRHYVRSFLVVGQLSLAIVVLIGAGLCLKSLRNLLAIDPGYQAENLLIVPLELDEKKYDAAHGSAFRTELL